MKPHADHESLIYSKRNFNVSFSKTHGAVENLSSQLKRRFQCLSKELHKSVGTSVPIIRACCILHILGAIKNQEFLEV